MKNLLKTLTLGTALALSSCTSCNTTIHGALGLSYIPSRIFERDYKNELKTEVDIHSETKISDIKLEIGERVFTYMNFDKVNLGGMFYPKQIDFQTYMTAEFPIQQVGSLEFSLFHHCFHPINKESIFISYYKDENGKMNYTEIFAMGETSMGVKIKF